MSAEPRLPLLRTRRGVPDAHLGDCPFATSESTRRVRCHSNGVIGEEHEGLHPCSGRRRLLPPPDYPQLFRRAAPRPSKSLRRSRHPSYAAWPGRALPRCASPRAAAACCCGGLGEPPALQASSGRRWRRAVAAAGRKSGFVFPACDVCPGYARRVPDAVCMRPDSPFLEYYPLEQSKRWVNDVEVSECLSGTGGLDHFGPARSNLSGMR